MELPKNLAPDQASPDWLSKGDNAWQLTAATLVGMQSVPGLVILYGSIVKKKWAVNSAFMALYAFAAVLVYWLFKFLDRPNVVMDQGFLLERIPSRFIPTATMIYFSFAFAAIMLILIARALLGRMNLYAWMLFGLIDCSGGYVIHLSSGVAGFTAAYWISTKQHSVGAGLLWMGWAGFNGGGPYMVNTETSLAVLNTHVCTATSLLIVGVVQGWVAIIMGVMPGSIPCYTMMVLHKKIGILNHVDETPWPLGGILAGFFAHPKLCRIFFLTENWQHNIGLAYGIHSDQVSAGFKQMGIQFLGLGFVVAVNVIITSIICLFLRQFIPLRLNGEQLQLGDDAMHGEEAYAVWGDGEKYDGSKHNSVYGMEEFPVKAPKAEP
ncbi:ammonium transporter 3 member 3-like [Pyrus ussuriensis x Pyrus communis]|uniref:Ammonium transporter 3 member 3-like n=1 Tax=Pyrus ussuriensis x Pyrus communis TaxID=2448454 RepID=A0A5N5GKP1_9ROSA|nr:ammonium transporter 3 member 3-like [Pyrus ussuriensis x Pyrus communis]